MKVDQELLDLEEKFGNWPLDEKVNEKLGAATMSSDLYPYTNLFSPIQINSVQIKNRIVMGPMGNLNMCEETGRPNEKMIEYFCQRAQGGAGLLTTGLIPVSHGIDPSVTETADLTLFPRIDHARTVFAGWRDLAQGVHAYGSKIFIQLTPGLGRVGPPTCAPTKHKLPVSASWNPNFYIPELPCRPLSDRSLRKIIASAGQAAADAQECGLDGVYLHGHEGYLLEQMTNPAFNRRKLGHFADVSTFGIELIEQIRKRVGKRYPIMYRIDLSLMLNETYKGRMDEVKSLKRFKNGRSIDETLEYMVRLVEAGVDIFDVDLGCYDNWWLPHPPEGMPAGCFLDIAKRAKDYFADHNIVSNAGLPVPVVAVGKLGYPDLAEKSLRDGDCDMVMLARPLLADPAWPMKAYAGKTEDIRPCIGCQEGCVNEFILGGHPQCAVNPRCGFEERTDDVAQMASQKKRICVIGAGPAGVAFAVTAAARGHEVEIFEKEDKIGGKLIPGSVPAIKFDVRNYLHYLEVQLQHGIEEGNIVLHLNTEADLDAIKADGFDVCVFATGTCDINPAFKGRDQISIVQATHLLNNPEELGDAKQVLIVGGGVVGCEVAHWLSCEKGRQVRVVEMLPHFMEGVCTANRGHLIHYLEKDGVDLICCTKVVSFDKGKVNVERNVSDTVPDPYNTWQPILPTNVPNPLAKPIEQKLENQSYDCDLVVLAMGGRPNNKGYFQGVANTIAPEIYNIGDSDSPGRVLEAVRSAYKVALAV